MGLDHARLLNKPYPFLALVGVRMGPDAERILGCLEQNWRLQRILASAPESDGTREAASGSHPIAQRREQQQRVAVEPARAALRLGKIETIGDKGFRVQIEFAQDLGVRAAARQMDDGAIQRPRQGGAAAPDPVFAFLGGESVDIDQHVPFRSSAQVAFERGGAPQTSGIGGVAPGIEQPSAPPIGQRDVVGAVENRLQRPPIGGDRRVIETPQRRGVLRLQPV
jgi:hypothetical protein